jgi:hypothetical protein
MCVVDTTCVAVSIIAIITVYLAVAPPTRPHTPQTHTVVLWSRPCPECTTFETAVHHILSTNRRHGNRASFVQIGANDGQNADPLYPFLKRDKSAWVGIMVEPTPGPYTKLRQLHRDTTGWGFYNGAMAPKLMCQNNSVSFWELPGHRYNETGWWTLVNTMDKNSPHIARGEKGGYLKPVTRACLADFSILFRRYGSQKFKHNTIMDDVYYVDLLLIDVECRDYDILSLIDFARFRPLFIQYEALDCMGPGLQRAANLLQSHGYELFQQGGRDVLARHQSVGQTTRPPVEQTLQTVVVPIQ